MGKDLPSGIVKLNFDGALLDGGLAMGLRVVARDDRGVCLVWLPCHVDRRGCSEPWQRGRPSNLLLVVGEIRLLSRVTVQC